MVYAVTTRMTKADAATTAATTLNMLSFVSFSFLVVTPALDRGNIHKKGFFGTLRLELASQCVGTACPLKVIELRVVSSICTRFDGS